MARVKLEIMLQDVMLLDFRPYFIHLNKTSYNASRPLISELHYIDLIFFLFHG